MSLQLEYLPPGQDTLTFANGSPGNLGSTFCVFIHPTTYGLKPTCADGFGSPFFDGIPISEFAGNIGAGVWNCIFVASPSMSPSNPYQFTGNALEFHKLLFYQTNDSPYVTNGGGWRLFDTIINNIGGTNASTFGGHDYTSLPLYPNAHYTHEFMVYITRDTVTKALVEIGVAPKATNSQANQIIAGIPLAGRYEQLSPINNVFPAGSTILTQAGLDMAMIEFYFIKQLAALPSAPAVNEPQFYLIGEGPTEFPLMGQFYPPNSTAARNHGAERSSKFPEFSYFGDQQPSIDAAPYVLTGTVVHESEAAHVAYLASFMEALKNALHIEYRIQDAVYRALLAQNVDSYFTRKSVQGKPWISELTVKLCVTSLEWQRISGIPLGNYETLL